MIIKIFNNLIWLREKLVGFYILFIIIGCSAEKNEKLFYAIPTINVKIGRIDTLDLSNYFRTREVNISLSGPSSHQLKNNKFIINGLNGKSGIEVVEFKAGSKDLNLVIRYIPMVKHEFKIKLNKKSNVYVMGQFNDWSRNSMPMIDLGDFYSIETYLEPKIHEYKFVVDKEEILDPKNENTVSNNAGGWNSLIDFSNMFQENNTQVLKRSKKGKRLYFDYLENGKVATPSDYLILFDNRVIKNYDTGSLKEKGISMDMSDFSDGLLRVFAINDQGIYTPENQTLISDGDPIDKSSDSWYLSIMYNPMIDRFYDGDPTNNRKINDPRLHDLTNFIGGDLEGITKKINDDYFSELGINTIWLSPIQTQPDSSWVEYIKPNRTFSGYHGYWPIESREIDPRYGSSEEFKDLVSTAHSNGIKIILDFVSNHVHQDHEYFKNHREWFGSLVMDDGRLNIRQWDGDTRLTTWFDEFLPSYNFVESDEAVNKVVEDAIWWLKEYNLDGFRQDAVKHVPHKFWKKLTRSIDIAAPNKTIYQIGETFGSDELILSYVNPSELSAQFNFSIYFNTRGMFSDDETDFTGLKQIIAQNARNYGPIHLMGNITSSHDQLRFVSYADGQISLGENGIERAFNDPVKNTVNNKTFNKLANYHAFNCSQPGIPIIYYGEEIGLIGELDPGNRRPMKFNIDKNERDLLEKFKAINLIRQNYSSLSIGDQTILISSGSLFVTLKTYFDEQMICAINNSSDVLKAELDIPTKYKQLINLVTNQVIEKNNKLVSISIQPYSHDFFIVKK